MTISLICIIVSLVVFALMALCGVFSGLRKGLFRSLVKLGALVLSVALALIITLCLRSVAVTNLLGIIPAVAEEYQFLIDLAIHLPAALVLLIGFIPIFTLIRLLMLIPQNIINRRLPKTYDELADRKDTVDAPDASSPFAQTEAERDISDRRIPRTVWKVSAALCGVLSSLLLVGAYLMPVSGLATRVGDGVCRISDAVAAEDYGDYADEVSGYSHAVASAPLLTVTDFFYGKTVFEPLTSFKTEYGRISLSDEIETTTDVACELLPVAIHLDRTGNIAEGDVERLAAATERIADSRFILTLGTYAIHTAGGELREPDPEASKAMQALSTQSADILTAMTPDTLSDDLRSVVALVDALADSQLLRTLTAEDAELSLTTLVDREVMRALFGVFYDNAHAKKLVVPLVNLATETAFDAMGAAPVYSTADIDNVTRDEMLEESERLCDAAGGLAEFADSVEANAPVYKLRGVGRALDCLRDSILFGDQYEALIQSLSAAGSNEDADTVLAALADALFEIDSAERLLTSAEDLMTLCIALEQNAGKGSESETLVNSIDALLNDTVQEDIELLTDIGGELFFSKAEGVDSDLQAEMIADCLNTLKTIVNSEEHDPAAEADAIQVFYDAVHGDPENIFAKVNETDAVDALLGSSITLDMLNTLSEEGRNYGVADKLTDANRAAIAAALSESNASDEQKQLIIDFFGVD